MKDNLIVALIISILIILICFYLKIANFAPKEDILLNRINELELKIDSLNNKKDSIKIAIDSTHIKIITNEIHYKERVNTIINQSTSDDSSFVSNYIRQWSNKNSLLNTQ